MVCSHADCENTEIRAIISAENRVDAAAPTVRFSLKPHKVFVFDPESGARLR